MKSSTSSTARWQQGENAKGMCSAKRDVGVKVREGREETDRIEVGQFFSGVTRTCGNVLLVLVQAEKTPASLALSGTVANLFGIPARGILAHYFLVPP